MITRDDITQAIEELIGHDLLVAARKLDHRANGVQLTGKDEVKKLCLGVTCTLDYLHEAVDSGADYCLFHHGLDLAPSSIYNSSLNQSQKKQLQFALANNLTIAGYHYSLDAQPDFGNAATIIKALGAKKLAIPYFSGWGWVAEFEKPQNVEELAEKCGDLFSHDIFAVYGGPSKISRLGVITGGGKPSGEYLHEIQQQNIDLHLTGEIGEPGPHLAKECSFNYFSCGHYATEVFGVQELGKKLKKQFGDKLEIEFIDIPNPL